MISNRISLEKIYDPLSTPVPENLERPMSACIFTNSDQKPHHRSQNSERRYTQNAENLEEILSESFLSSSSQREDLFQIKAGKLLDYKENAPVPPQHYRRGSHQRKRSICTVEEISAEQLIQEVSLQSRIKDFNISTRNTSKAPSEEGGSNAGSRNQSPKCHIRHASDADSVIYIGFGDDLTNSKIFGNQKEARKSNKCEMGEETWINKSAEKALKNDEKQINSIRNSRQSYERNPLPVLGNMPSSVYCDFCKMYVHTKIEFLSKKVPGRVLKIFSSFFACCQIPVWLSKLRVHRCPHCALVLAKSR
ncbi:unnamed protein product [Blepharisma stoltei]|uniref:LITAF domain-containing protein n=1 Tax=Blepharisma stoltei TaxID=1481888 RepID=A0AAU9K653_9CILI|nr:unnamed protein product [Blepharisma stoltei]